ncbi:TIM barrel protein [Paenibacillus kribbensis]|uniref:sugar phosphate isomerase/epimerase family protein n=1 Tax=Paenibacillus kribbensis TaxID=172713 RepID=UPI002DB5B2EA|nr:TIM barrel protein [Paenibacillus kribbensis]MEC0236159.1 TIM barrel protein [Paenibacillus kribbensis]
MENWRDKLEISIVHPGLWPASASDVREWEHSVRAILEDPFFERIEVAPIADQQRRRQFNGWLRIANMKASYLLQPLIFGKEYDLQSSDTAERTFAVNRIIEAMDEAVESGADRVAVISGPKDPKEETEDQLDRLCESLLLLDEAAAERKLQLDLELFDTTVDKKRLFGESTMAAKLMGRLGRQTASLALLVDLSHVPLLEETIEDTVFNTKAWLGHVHIGNCSTKRDDGRFGDKHPYFGYPNGCHSVAEVSRFLQALHNVGYLTLERKAGLGIEIMAEADEEPGMLIAGAKRTLIQALQNVKVDAGKVGELI